MKVFIVQQRNWALRVGVPLVEYIHKKNPEIIFSSLVYKECAVLYIFSSIRSLKTKSFQVLFVPHKSSLTFAFLEATHAPLLN